MKIRTTRDLAAVVRQRRRQLDWSQARLATASGVGRDWIVQFEKGKSTVELGLVLRILKALSLTILLNVDEAPSRVPESSLDAVLSRTRKSAQP
jgi:HTH-type transcriptional regulator / antitoxin HipB